VGLTIQSNIGWSRKRETEKENTVEDEWKREGRVISFSPAARSVSQVLKDTQDTRGRVKLKRKKGYLEKMGLERVRVYDVVGWGGEKINSMWGGTIP